MIKFLQYAALIVPWFSLGFTTSANRKKYMPVTIFGALIMTVVFQIAHQYDWWVIKKSIVPWGYMSDVTFIYGLFAVGTFWIFRFTSDKFPMFIILNAVMDSLMSFVILPLLGTLGIAHYKNISPWQYFLVIFGISFLLWIYHKWQEKIFKSENS
ncbi:hypothetical protein AM500_12885 [Bacillus sp. FJAT-18017]|uniref:hypothetical protein n=1 Tax=Bacillus sp. FJAT-18017 TaxID=1705566 RepID=UPI0006AF2B46|nr:hypothetical protein [Bacillus sp. FJAT-18017]ALC90582.1 hypothetical protein AM500_12885 [Bacillus sp. FJAT-18017]